MAPPVRFGAVGSGGLDELVQSMKRLFIALLMAAALPVMGQGPMADWWARNARPVASVAAWTPAQINTYLWLDAADSSKVSTTPNNTVSQWTDKSTNGCNFYQPTGEAQPAYGSVTINGKSVITFDGANDTLTNKMLRVQPFWTFAIYRVINAWNAADADVFHSYGGSFVLRPWWSGSGTPWIAYAGQYPPEVQGNGSKAPIGTNVWATYWNGAGSTNYFNAVAGDTGNAGAYGFSGATLLGKGTVFLKFDLAELIATPPLSAGDRQKIEGYVCWKWGIQTSLPTNHPYYSAAP